MSRLSRSDFLRDSAVLAAATAAGAVPASVLAGEAPRAAPLPPVRGPGVRPDMVVLNARVHTIDDALPRAEAFAVHAGRFLAVGSSDELRNIIAPGTAVIDAGGMTVVPGFIDTHAHPDGVSELINVDTDLGSIAAIRDAMRRKAAQTPPGFWVRGFKYDDTKLAEGRALTRRDLDEAVPDHPAVVGHRGGHTGVYNSRAFELAGVTVNTPDPAGGKFYRENGELTGKVAERARNAFGRVGRSQPVTRELRQAGVKRISEQMTAAGLTSVHRTGMGAEALTAFRDAYDAGELRFRLYGCPSGGLFNTLKEAGVRTGFGDEWLRIGAVKFSADGSASERTMYMSSPYVGRPDDYGILLMPQAEIDAAVEDAHRAGFQIGIHANGDRTIDMVLRAYERVQALFPRPDVRHRIEHCSLVNPDLLRRIAAGGYIPTPFWTYAHYHGEKWAEYGAAKMQWMFAHRSFLDYGIRVPGASDYMPGPFEPLMALQSMVTRKDMAGRVWGANQRVTVAEALRIGTSHGAYASFEEQLKGSITAGKLADFVMLAEDPHEVEPDRLKHIRVVRTVVGGRTMHLGG
ncbi:MAG TPA: amidohydrolase [Longimicrobiales bacterium]|nr:amidohydrolase [Longimicrobiales bacterium]